jgi:hypothetical protein
MHVDGVEATTSSIIAELRNDGGPNRAWVLTGRPCEQQYAEVRVGDTFALAH